MPDTDHLPLPEPRADVQDGLFNFIKHGDAKHQNWLRRAVNAYFAGEPRPVE